MPRCLRPCAGSTLLRTIAKSIRTARSRVSSLRVAPGSTLSVEPAGGIGWSRGSPAGRISGRAGRSRSYIRAVAGEIRRSSPLGRARSARRRRGPGPPGTPQRGTSARSDAPRAASARPRGPSRRPGPGRGRTRISAPLPRTPRARGTPRRGRRPRSRDPRGMPPPRYPALPGRSSVPAGDGAHGPRVTGCNRPASPTPSDPPSFDGLRRIAGLRRIHRRHPSPSGDLYRRTALAQNQVRDPCGATINSAKPPCTSHGYRYRCTPRPDCSRWYWHRYRSTTRPRGSRGNSHRYRSRSGRCAAADLLIAARVAL